jgi:hypothetical protein
MEKAETGDRNADRGKKPYERPDLECASVYEAAAGTLATCCKVTNRTCSLYGRSSLGKNQRRQTLS